MDNDFWSSFDSFQSTTALTRTERDEEYRRGTFERIFAPFEAPQQFLYKLTTGIAENGFQFGDLLDATTHGARYFNPFSNQMRIDENEIRQIFLGEDRDPSKTTLMESATNLGIALLYDPLWLLAPAKAAGTAMGMSTRAVRVIENVVNPASAVIDGGILGFRAANKAVTRTAENLLGANRAELIGTKLQNLFVSQFAGVPEAARDAMRTFEAKKANWRQRGAATIKASKDIGGRQGQELLAEALELDALYYSRRGDQLSAAQRQAFDSFENRLVASGIDRNRFFEVYDSYRGLDDEIGQELVQLGAITSKELEDYRGTHLRRVFEAFEKPGDYLDKVEALVAQYPDTVRVRTETLAQELSQFPDVLRDMSSAAFRTQPRGTEALFSIGAADVAESTAGNLRNYFNAAGDFEVTRLVDDFDALVRNNPTATADEIMKMTQESLFGIAPRAADAGLDLNRADAKIYKTLLNYMSGGLDEVKGAQYYADMLRSRLAGPPVVWRTMQENMAVVAERGFIPEEIREALGEVTTAAPRLARGVGESTDLLEFRRFADELTGTRRWTADEIAEIERISEQAKAAGQTREAVAATVSERFGVQVGPNDLARIEEGKVAISTGTDAANISDPRALSGASVQLPADERLGTLSGAWVKPAIARYVTNVLGRDPTGGMTVSQKMMHQFSEGLRRGTSIFKEMKVVLDPTAQARNFLGNSVLADWAGVSQARFDVFRKASQTLKSFARGEMNDYARLAALSGYDLMGNTFSKSELRHLGDELAGIDLADVKDTATGMLSRVFGAMGKSVGEYRTFMRGQYQHMEEFFKMSVFINKVDELKAPLVKRGTLITPEVEGRIARQAAALAEEALFNYADLPYLAQWVRDYGAVPFISFPIKATQYTAKTLYENPWQVLKYHRTANEWNDVHSGGPDQTAKEIAALPQYIRDAMVVRLPFEDADDRPLYVDLSYFMPYQVIKEALDSFGQVSSSLGISPVANDLSGSGGGMGLREGYFNPPVVALLTGIFGNEDSFGRDIRKPEYGAVQNFAAMGQYLAEFILPPSVAGGSRAESIGRALQAVARTSPEPMNWAEMLAVSLRGVGPNMNDVFTYPGQRPQTGAAVAGSQLGGLLGLEQTSPASMFLGIGETLMTGGSVASDPGIAARQIRTGQAMTNTEIARRMAQIRSDTDLSPAERNARLQRLLEMRRENQKKSSDLLSNLR